MRPRRQAPTAGGNAVTPLYGNVVASEFGLVFALGDFTARAKSFARSKANLRLVSRRDLAELILDNCERLDSRHKGLITRKRVYVPQGVGSD